MIRRFELTNKQFALIEDLLPARGQRGGRWHDHRTTLNGIFLVALIRGAQWREVPERYGKAKSIWGRSNFFWRADATLDRILERLHLRLNAAGRIDPVLWCVDATSIRASRSGDGRGAGKKTGPATLLTKPWAARAAALAPRCIWSSMVTASPRRPRSARAKRTRANGWSPRLKRCACPAAKVDHASGPRSLAGDQGYRYPAVRAYPT